jgi:SEC-C motif-containing protein
VSGFGSRAAKSIAPDDTCPCGGLPRGALLAECCGPLLAGERDASTAEALMRSRYTAYVLGDGDHLFRTWHPRTRTDDADPDDRVRWVGLEVLDVVDGGADDAEGVVEFRARWVSADDGPVRRGELHERSRFVRRAGRWVYVEAG